MLFKQYFTFYKSNLIRKNIFKFSKITPRVPQKKNIPWNSTSGFDSKNFLKSDETGHEFGQRGQFYLNILPDLTKNNFQIFYCSNEF